MHFPDLMRRLGAELGLPDFAPDAEGACALQRGILKVSFYADPDDCFTAICPLGPINVDNDKELQALLRGNLFADGVGGTAIGIDGEGCAYLTQSFRATDLGFNEFKAALERYVAAATHLRQVIASGQAADVL